MTDCITCNRIVNVVSHYCLRSAVPSGYIYIATDVTQTSLPFLRNCLSKMTAIKKPRAPTKSDGGKLMSWLGLSSVAKCIDGQWQTDRQTGFLSDVELVRWPIEWRRHSRHAAAAPLSSNQQPQQPAADDKCMWQHYQPGAHIYSYRGDTSRAKQKFTRQ